MNEYSLVVSIVGIFALICIAYTIIKPYLDEKNKINKMNVENEKMKILSTLDPKIALEEVIKLIDTYIDNYVLHKFIVYRIDYIKKDDIEKMIKDLDTKIFVELSELYLFYIRIITNISTEEELIQFLHKKISERVLKFTVEFNKPK